MCQSPPDSHAATWSHWPTVAAFAVGATSAGAAITPAAIARRVRLVLTDLRIKCSLLRLSVTIRLRVRQPTHHAPPPVKRIPETFLIFCLGRPPHRPLTCSYPNALIIP